MLISPVQNEITMKKKAMQSASALGSCHSQQREVDCRSSVLSAESESSEDDTLQCRAAVLVDNVTVSRRMNDARIGQWLVEALQASANHMTDLDASGSPMPVRAVNL